MSSGEKVFARFLVNVYPSLNHHISPFACATHFFGSGDPIPHPCPLGFFCPGENAGKVNI